MSFLKDLEETPTFPRFVKIFPLFLPDLKKTKMQNELFHIFLFDFFFSGKLLVSKVLFVLLS